LRASVEVDVKNMSLHLCFLMTKDNKHLKKCLDVVSNL